jgi:hypothetical protein
VSGQARGQLVSGRLQVRPRWAGSRAARWLQPGASVAARSVHDDAPRSHSHGISSLNDVSSLHYTSSLNDISSLTGISTAIAMRRVAELACSDSAAPAPTQMPVIGRRLLSWMPGDSVARRRWRGAGAGGGGMVLDGCGSCRAEWSGGIRGDRAEVAAAQRP